MDYYRVTICGVERQLPIVAISRNLKLAAFNFLGDVELVDRLADTFTEKLQPLQFDYLITPHAKITPLIHGIAKRLNHTRYVVCRKSVKGYMNSPLIVKPSHDYPKHVKPLVVNSKDVQLIQNKRVVVIDDVLSTGKTIQLTHSLLSQINASVVTTCIVFTQGDLARFTPSPLISLGQLPILRY